ncbi:unnamed protein product [Kuraishia capsulata CBS 1993]|uniref:Alkyl transferase n=1 Tax=Kuraishia capsulata CBS 1993 TaxID=1382522 RepID=W6MPQ0_9ASCO|nr:uncharacterized protein KUCA_T00004600001 [Kuraishia capsulata CBS 1993]CDK28616.1 unnamed protein product [Kuraishia capsulata CBS 1993]
MLSNSDPASYLFDVKIKIVGNKTMIPAEILVDLEKIEEKTARHTNKILNVCFPYTSRDDIAHSVSTIVDRVKNGEMQTVDITEQALDENMYFGTDSPKMDILIRTSGHTRLSDFMTWQCHDQSMIEFVNVLWPDFNFVSIFWVLFKWGYYKSLILEDTQVMQPNKFANEGSVPNFKHPPFASVSEV